MTTGPLPDLMLTPELLHDARITWLSDRRCGRRYFDSDIQSAAGQFALCGEPAIVHVELSAGQHYDLCGRHARELGIDFQEAAKAEGAGADDD